MLTSLALIFLLGIFLGKIATKLKLPALVGMIIAGMILNPYGLNLLDSSILDISADLRQLALVIILIRAGLSLDINDLKKVGRPAILLCFVPALFEIVGIVLIAPKLLGVSTLEAAVMGAVVAAVSPAVIVPRMINLMEKGYGKDKSIPLMLMAGASVDDVFVIVLFYAFTSLVSGKFVSIASFVQIPISIALGIILGVICGIIVAYVFPKLNFRNSIKVIILLSISFLLIALEKKLEGIIPISGLLAIMSMGASIYQKNKEVSAPMSAKVSKLWAGAEILLFVLVGATVDTKYAIGAGLMAFVCIVFGLIFRMIGVFISVQGTNLNTKERLFCMMAYFQKLLYRLLLVQYHYPWDLNVVKLCLLLQFWLFYSQRPLEPSVLIVHIRSFCRKVNCYIFFKAGICFVRTCLNLY